MDDSTDGPISAEEVAARSFPGVVWTTDTSLRVTSIFGRFVSEQGLDPSDVVGRTIPEVVGTHDSAHPVLEGHARALAGETAEYPMYLFGRELHTTVEPLRHKGEVVGVVGLGTQHEGGESEIRQRVTQQAAVAELGLEAARATDLDAILAAATETVLAGLKAHGAAVVEALPDGETMRVRVIRSESNESFPDEFARSKTLVDLALTRDEPMITGDLRNDSRLKPGGHPFQSEIAAPIRRQGKSFGALAVFSRTFNAFTASDVYFVRAVANILSGFIGREEARALASVAFDAVPDALFIVGPGRLLVDVNAAAERLTGMQRDELIGLDPILLSVDEAGMEERDRRFSAGEEIETRLRGANGEIRRVLATAVPNFRPGLALWTTRDVTEQRRLERELQQAHKMQTVGELAAGIAHDFNNLLIVVRGLSEVVLDELEPGSVLRGDIEAIHQAGIRGIAAVDRLLAFARPLDDTEAQVIRVSALLSGLEPFLRQLVHPEIELVISGDETSGVLLDPRDLEQAVLNLVMNAQDAIAGRGAIRVTVDERSIMPPEAGELGLVPERYVVLSVGDDGGGMDDTTRARALDPFFTTKAATHGTGLGLPMVARVARTAGGGISVRSSIGTGTDVTVFLPAVGGEVAPSPTPVASRAAPRGSETILVVDDDPLVLRFATRALRRFGYSVITSGSGREAVAAVSAHPEISAALIDVVMPVAGGAEVVDLLRAQRPNLKVCLMSAYSNVPRGKVLPKPFTEDQLARAMRLLLD